MASALATATEIDAMRRALEVAAQGAVQGPNPRVGCVLLDTQGRTVAEGHHRGAGTPHAEVDALAAARRHGHDVRGGTAVVTLEPCAHHGRTPPCAHALIQAGVARVVIGANDPNPVAAGGVAALRAAGIEVSCGVLAQESEALNRAWFHAIRTGRPLVTWKFAATLDGRSAAADGSSRWITSAAARKDAHQRRARVDAIAVGTGTVFADDPSLTVRDVERPTLWHPPLRVVIGEREIPGSMRVVDDAAPTALLRSRELRDVLAELHRREVRSLWLEGGPRLAAAFWQLQLIDEVIVYLAPALLGAGTPAVADLGVTTMADIQRLEPLELRALGPDVMIRAVPHYRRGLPEQSSTPHYSHPNQDTDEENR